MQDTPAQELQQLRRELHALKKDLRELRKFVQIIPGDPDRGTSSSATIVCNSLIIAAPGEQAQAVLHWSREGAQLIMTDAAGKPRIEITSGESPSIVVFDSNGDAAAELGLEEETSCGRMLISDAGQPRAVVKATPDGGCLSVLHDDGRPRASIISTAHNGAELLMITPDLKPGIRASSGTAHGGLITVHKANGSPAVTLMSGKSTSGVVVSKGDGTKTIFP